MQSATKSPDTRTWDLLNRLSDEELAAEFLAGGYDALTVLFDRYHKLVFGVALRIVQDAAEAEEVVQIVFLEIFRALANFDPRKGILKVWLLQFAYGRALNRRRYLNASRFYDLVSLDSATIDLSSYQETDHSEVARLIEELLDSLSPRRKEVVELTYFEGLTANEISERLGISADVVRHELYRGLAKLRKSFARRAPALRKEPKNSGKEVLVPNAQAL